MKVAPERRALEYVFHALKGARNAGESRLYFFTVGQDESSFVAQVQESKHVENVYFDMSGEHIREPTKRSLKLKKNMERNGCQPGQPYVAVLKQ